MGRFVQPRSTLGLGEEGLRDDTPGAEGAWLLIEQSQVSFLTAIEGRLRVLQPEAGQSVCEAARLLVKAGMLPSEIADLFEVSRASVGRWIDGENVPRSVGFRRAVLNLAVDQVTELLRQCKERADVLHNRLQQRPKG